MGNKENEWNRFRVGRPSTNPHWTEPNCVPFTDLAHYTHLETAFTSLRDSILRAGLVYDESKLNKKRIRVLWLSPNDWEHAGGFRYGNVGFSFKWQKLIRNLKFYWIESIPYTIPACRILITENDYDSLFDRYDPTIGDGPWRCDGSTGEHYWNGYYCLEIMFEGDLNLSKGEGVEIGSHSSRYCSLHRDSPRSCPDFGLDRNKASGLFLARIVGAQMNNTRLAFTKRNGEGKIIPTFNLESGFNNLLWELLRDVNFCGSLGSKDPVTEALIHAIFLTYSYRNHDEQKKLTSLFVSKEEFLSCCRNVVGKAFELSDPASLCID